jgi:hypothetical protein
MLLQSFRCPGFVIRRGRKSTRIDYQYHRLQSLPAGCGTKFVPASEYDDEAHVDSSADILNYLPEEI